MNKKNKKIVGKKSFPRPAPLTVANLKKFDKTVGADPESTTSAYGDSIKPHPSETDDQISAVDSVRIPPS